MSDRYGYVSPARVKVLVVPINHINTSYFQRCLNLIQAVNEITLLDITPMPELRYFNPQSFPQGRILYDFSSDAPDNESIFLHDFEPYRKTFVVLGVGKYDPSLTRDSVDEFSQNLKKLYPSSICQNCIIFDTPSEQVLQFNPANDHSLKHSFFFNPQSTKTLSLDTIMCEISRNFLFHLDNYANSYNTITLRSPVSISDSQLLAKTITKAQKRLSSGSSSLKVSFANQTPSLSAASDPKHRNQARNDGRHSKLLASFFLLAGKYVDALNHFTDALLHLRKSDDSMWLGSALEGIGVSVILLNYVHVPYQLPNAVLTTVLSLSKSKIRDMSIDNVSRKMSGESLTQTISESTTSANGHENPSQAAAKSISSPRNSSSSRISFGSNGPITAGPDLGLIAIPELIKQLAFKVDYYFQLSTNDFENTVPDLVYIEWLLRYMKFMISVYVNGSNIDASFFESLVKCTRATNTHSTNPWFSKHDILNEVEKIFSLQLVDLGLVHQCRIYCSIASTYNDLQMVRKKSFILRTLVVAILPQLAETLETRADESVHSINGNGRSFSGVNNSDVEKSISSVKETHDTTFSSVHSIRDLIKVLFIDYGLNLQPEVSSKQSFKNVGNNWSSMQLSLIKLSIRIFESLKDYESLVAVYCLALTRYVHCLPPDDEMQLKHKIDDLLKSTTVRIPYWDPFLVRSIRFLNNRNQSELVPFTEYSETAKRESASSLNQDLNSTELPSTDAKIPQAPFVFDPFNKPVSQAMDRERLLIKNEIYQLKITLQNPYSFDIDLNDIQICVEDGEVQTIRSGIRSMNGSAQLNGVVSPQLPRAATQSRVTINNPKQRPETKSLVDSAKVTSPKLGGGPDYFGNGSNYSAGNTNSTTATQGVSIIIPPKTMETIIIPFKPLSSGTVRIKGFNIVVGHCDGQFFPIIDSEQSERANKLKTSEDIDSKTDPLMSVITNLTTFSKESAAARVNCKTLELMVVEPQPSLSLVNLSVSNGWLMLLEGEKYQFSIGLTNQSNQIINYLSFSFWDSTIQSLSRRLNTSTIGNQLTASDIHEIEWSLLKFKSFRILNKQEINNNYNPIVPYQDIKIDYEITGKKGMTNSKMILEYGNKLADLTKSFVKTIEIPLNLTIVPSIELMNYDIIPLFLSTLEGVTGDKLNQYQNLKSLHEFVGEIVNGGSKISDYCLFVLDMRNSWDEELEIDVTFQVSKQKGFKINDVLKPKKTFRYLIPMQRISTLHHNLHERIPSLRNKQYVKDYSLTESEESDMRQAFWLREIILNKVSGTWKRPGRTGDIQFRNIRLSQKMINCLIYPKIQVMQEIYDNQKLVERTDLQFQLSIEQFYTLKTTITNNSDENISGMLRHIPFAINSNDHGYHVIRDQVNIDKKLLINGLTQSRLPKTIKPKESLSVQLSFVVLENGEYEWGTVLDLVSEKIVPREPVHIVATQSIALA